MGLSFEDYCEEFFDMDVALMNEQQLSESKKSYAEFLKKAKASDEKHQKALAKAKESRKLAKFYGGKALAGTAAQKKWAEDIRQQFLESNELTDEQKKELVACGGFTNSAKFWIENRSVAASKMTARNIVAQYRGLKELEEKHHDTLARTGTVASKNAARKEIQNYINTCDFKFV